MSHVVLLGDSIFDNGAYVPGQPAVIEQLQKQLPGWQASLLAIDGDIVSGMPRQLARLPADATHLAISVGGNDALRNSRILGQPVTNVAQALQGLSAIQADFQGAYREMLALVLSRRLPTVVCTIYDAIPGLEREATTALGLFNEVILREAIAARLPVLELRLLCHEQSDYSPLSPIEPSHRGGEKIAAALARIVTKHEFGRRESVVYWTP